jgi:hypothetical protein
VVYCPIERMQGLQHHALSGVSRNGERPKELGDTYARYYVLRCLHMILNGQKGKAKEKNVGNQHLTSNS